VTIVGEMLRERFRFKNEQITLLLDNDATHSGIKNAFESLIERVQDNDFVYIHYSGHGSQTKNLNEDKGDIEPDGKDETWVSYESRSGESAGADNYDVLDDEIDAWLAAIYAKTNQVVFVSDSCHSATVSRGESVISRAVEEDQREHPLGKQDYTPLATYPGIRVGAARDPESAIEVPFEGDKHYGLFTYFWVQALQQARDGETWNDVFKRAYTRVTAGWGDVQRPQIWGESRGLQIGGGFTAMKPTIAVSAVQDNVVTIQAGFLAGVTVGSIYRLYAPDTHPSPLPGGENPPLPLPSTGSGHHPGGENPPLPLPSTSSGHRPGGELPTLEITETGPFVSSGKPEGTFHTGDLVIEERHAYQFAPIKVYLQADDPENIDKPVLEAIRSAFASADFPKLPAYTLTNDPKQADLHLYVPRPKQENGQYLYKPGSQDVLPQSFPDQPPEVWVLTPEHRLLYENLKISFADQARGMTLLQDNLNKFVRLRDLKTLSSPGVVPEVTIDVYHLGRENCAGEPDCVLLPGGRGWHRKSAPFPFQDLGGDTRILPFNERYTFTLRNTSDKDYYCYLLDIMPDGEVSAIFPNPNLPLGDALIEAGKSRDLTQESSFISNMKGEEILKFIVSRQSFDVSLLEMKRFEQRDRTKGNYNPLEWLLLNAFEIRGPDHYQVDEWATEQVGFEVKE
jgi:hypothetical protein